MEGTIIEAVPFDRESDAKAIYGATKGIGTREVVITEILTKRTNGQRQDIIEAYALEYGTSMVDVLRSELSGDYLRVVESLLDEPPMFLAKLLNKYCTNTSLFAPTDLTLRVLEIIFPLNYVELCYIKESYHKAFGTELDEDMASHLSGPWLTILINIVQGYRNETAQTDEYQLNVDATYLQEKFINKWELPNSKIEDLLTRSSIPQLQALLSKLMELTNMTISEITDAINDSDLTTEQKKGFTMIVEMGADYVRFNASSLGKAVAGLGSDDDALIRIIAFRSEIDLENIKASYQQLYGKSLRNAISNDTSGDYRDALLSILGD